MFLGESFFGSKNRIEKYAKYLDSKIKEDKQYNIMIAHANDLENGKKLLNCLLTNHSNIKKTLHIRAWRSFRSAYRSRWFN